MMETWNVGIYFPSEIGNHLNIILEFGNVVMNILKIRNNIYLMLRIQIETTLLIYFF